MKRGDIVIGASEAATALDLDDYRTPLQLYAEKVGLIDRDDEDTEAAWLGRHLEHSIADAFAEKHDVILATSPSLRATSKPWLRATPDRLILPGGMSQSFRRAFDIDPDEVVGIEIKTTGLASFKPARKLAEEWGAPGSDVVPQRYVVQTLVQAGVVNEHLVARERSPLMPMLVDARPDLVVRRVLVVALLPGRGLVEYVVRSDPSAVAAVVGALDLFVEQHLVPEVPPAPQTADDWRILGDALRRKADPAKVVRKIDDADDPVSIAVGAHLAATAQLEAAEIEKARLRARLIEIIGDGYAVETPMGKALLTAPSEKSTPRLSSKAFADDVIEVINEEAKLAPSPLTTRLLDLVEKHTKSHTTGRTLRVTPAKDKP